jgi:hypothetical protein
MENMDGISVADYAKKLSEQGYSQATETIDRFRFDLWKQQ